MDQDLLERVQVNIRAEARRFLLTGEPMSKRGSQWDEFTKSAMEEEKLKITDEEKASAKRKMETRLANLKKQIKEYHGLNFDEWLKWAKSLYTITDDFKVVSTAKNWKEEQSWECGCEVAALEKIAKLLQYKEYDHWVRNGS